MLKKMFVGFKIYLKTAILQYDYITACFNYLVQLTQTVDQKGLFMGEK